MKERCSLPRNSGFHRLMPLPDALLMMLAAMKQWWMRVVQLTRRWEGGKMEDLKVRGWSLRVCKPSWVWKASWEWSLLSVKAVWVWKPSESGSSLECGSRLGCGSRLEVEAVLRKKPSELWKQSECGSRLSVKGCAVQKLGRRVGARRPQGLLRWRWDANKYWWIVSSRRRRRRQMSHVWRRKQECSVQQRGKSVVKKKKKRRRVARIQMGICNLATLGLFRWCVRSARYLTLSWERACVLLLCGDRAETRPKSRETSGNKEVGVERWIARLLSSMLSVDQKLLKDWLQTWCLE